MWTRDHYLDHPGRGDLQLTAFDLPFDSAPGTRFHVPGAVMVAA
jgi:hypothetical protein